MTRKVFDYIFYVLIFTLGFFGAAQVHLLVYKWLKTSSSDNGVQENQFGVLKFDTVTVAVTWNNQAHLNNSLFERQGNFVLRQQLTGKDLRRRVALFPEESSSDRIWNQMRYLSESNSSKTILLWHGLGSTSRGNSAFRDCPASRCYITDQRDTVGTADVIMWHGHYSPLPSSPPRPPHQVWLYFNLESPWNSPAVHRFDGKLNWTATYRRDSTIVAPYFKFTPFDYRVKVKNQTRNYANGKTKKVAWFVSNCATRNRRMSYVKELSNFIDVDIYGLCGSLKCPRYGTHCFEMLNKDYKFYLAFENSNCRDYITEKFFLNALSRDVVPIAMGAHPDDYKKVAPPNSFIHVDEFESPKELAQYLHKLDHNDDLYNGYFSWKGTGLVDTNTFFWCRLCSVLHANFVEKRSKHTYYDMEDWWRHNKCLPNGQRRWTAATRMFTNTEDDDDDDENEPPPSAINVIHT